MANPTPVVNLHLHTPGGVEQTNAAPGAQQSSAGQTYFAPLAQQSYPLQNPASPGTAPTGYYPTQEYPTQPTSPGYPQQLQSQPPFGTAAAASPTPPYSPGPPGPAVGYAYGTRGLAPIQNELQMVSQPVENQPDIFSVPDYMGISLITACCCCCPIGCFAVYNSWEARNAVGRNNYASALHHSKWAWRLSIISIVVAIFTLILIIGLVVGLVVFGVQKIKDGDIKLPSLPDLSLQTQADVSEPPPDGP